MGQTSRTKPPESWVIDISSGNSNSSKEGVESGLDKFQNRSKSLASKVLKDRKDSINYIAAGSPSNKRDAIKPSHSNRPPSSPSFGGNNVNSVDSKIAFSPSSNQIAHTSYKNNGIVDFQNQTPFNSVLSDYTNPVNDQIPGATASGPGKLKHLTLFQHHTPIRCASVIPNIGPYHNRELGSNDAVFALGNYDVESY